MSYVMWQLVCPCSRGKKFFSSPKCSDRPWDHPDSCSLGTRGPFGGLKWLVHEADCSCPSSAKVKNVCCYTSVLLHVFMMCTGTHTSLYGCEPRSFTLRDDVRVCTGVI